MCISSTILNMPFVAGLAPQLVPTMGAFFSLWFWQLIMAILGGLSYMFLLNMSVLLVRRRWLAVSVFVLVTTMVLALTYPAFSAIAVARPIFLIALICYSLTRFGVLTAVAFIYSHSVLQAFPLTTNRAAWYGHITLFAIASVLAVAVYAFHTTLARRPLWPARFRDG
jgi:hypothetical protein